MTAVETTSTESIFPSVPQLRKVFDFIEANYHQLITVEEVIQVFDYSPTYLTNLVQKQTGQSLGVRAALIDGLSLIG